ncbi:WD40/YVTN/BNR-like repeat-containing protein, partial [Planctomycetota bacterium]
ALVEAPVGDGGVYRSDDRGESFKLVSTQASLLDRPFYYCNIDADPTNAEVLYVNSTGYFKSVDGGVSWRRGSTPHGDNHDMWINPNNPDVYIQCNDGGANVTRDGGQTWSTQNNQMTAELYQIAVDDQFCYWVYAGQQDNSTIMVPSLPPYSPAIGPTGYWQAIGGCETGPAVPKPGNHNIVYANCKGRFGRYNKLTGQEKQYYVGAANMYGHNPRDLKYRFQRVSPIHVSPHDPGVVYHCSQYVHKTTDEGVTWETISPDLTAFEPDKQVISGEPITRDITGEEFYSTIYAVQESPLEKGLIWVGSNDGPIHVTRDGGETWSKVTPTDLPPGGRVQNVEPSPHDAGKAYVAVYRYLLGDWQPYIYRTNDYGKSWTRLTTGRNGIPADYPTRVVREDPDREGLLYAGTEFGMYISFDDGSNWQSFQLNLPATPVTDIKVYRQDLVLSTMGRSFWILDNVTRLHQMNRRAASSEYYLFAPRDAYRMRYRASGRGGSNPEYSAPGVMIDYYLAEETSEEVTLEILDAGGKLVRGFSSARAGESPITSDQLDIKEFHLERFGTARLAKEAGMHRFVWDMKHAGPWSASGAGRSGPTAVPGTYQVKLTVGDWSSTERFVVRIDPRVAADGVTQSDMAEQLSLCLKVRDTISRARMAHDIIRKELRQRPNDEKLAALEAKFVTAPGRYMTPMLLDQLSYLNSMLDRADQKPGRDAYMRHEELSGLLAGYIAELRQIMKGDM